MNTILAIDFDRWAAETYRANFPGVEVICASVADHVEKLPLADIIIGGPPCQPYSQAGERKGEDDERDCVPDFIDAVENVKPRMFLMENVDGLLSIADGRVAQKIFTMFEDAGYVVEVKTLDAVQFGVPQFRSRCWWWGIRKDLYAAGIRHQWPTPTHCWPPQADGLFGGHALAAGITVGQALGIVADFKYRRGSGLIDRGGDRRLWTSDEPSQAIIKNTGKDLIVYDHGVAHLDAPCPTLKAGGNVDANGHQGGGCPPIIEYRWSDAMYEKHPPPPPAPPASPASTVQAKYYKGGAEGLLMVDEPKRLVRRLTPDECRILQSAPDDFKWPAGIAKTQKYRVIGNGWASRMGAVFAEAFRHADPESETTIDLFCGGGLGACGWHGRYWSYV